MLLGTGAVPGTGGLTPEPIVAASPFFGSDEFRIGLSLPAASAAGSTFAAMRLRLASLGGLGSFSAVRALGLPTGPVAISQGPGGSGYATWRFPLTTTPAMVGLAFDAQWWVRDRGAPGGVARSESLRFTVE